VTTNIVIVKLKDDFKAITKVAELDSLGIKCAPFGPQYIRFVTHLNFDDEALSQFIKIIKH
jgi:threonine aldolase